MKSKLKKSPTKRVQNPSLSQKKSKAKQLTKKSVKFTATTSTTNKSRNNNLKSWFEKYLRYTDYIAAAQLYLKENCLLETELKQEHIKDRILGHWGTVPGLNLIYAHLNYLIYKYKANMLLVVGPGHGAPAILANLFAEKSIAEYYSGYELNKEGTSKLIKMFSWPGGFPSHTNPGTPGSILEGGELGYSLATAYGAVLDNPNLIAACVVGDGEAETGPLATAWHSNKYLNPKKDGAVIPILHANGYKITSPTIYASMNDEELTQLFNGFGYEVKIVDVRHSDLNEQETLMNAMEWAYQTIKRIQNKARSSKKPLLKPRWPMIVVRSLKGQTGVKELQGHKIEGTYRSHGIPLQKPKTDALEFQKLKAWLESYRIHELIDKKGAPLPEVMQYVPKGKYRLGMNPHTNGGKLLKELKLPNLKKYEQKASSKKAYYTASSTTSASDYMSDIFTLNAKTTNFRFMCPDETESNKFQSLFKATKRAFQWPLKSYDENLSPDGRVMEMLSEHTLMGWLEGYLLTGRHGIFVTYEAFAMIIASMTDQYAKFIKQALRTKWRKPVASLNILLTSVGWRQEHNGYSHQNPGFISNILEKHGPFCSAYFPADANSLLVTLEDCFRRKNSVNVIVAGKQNLPQWLTLEQAREELKTGIGIWNWIHFDKSRSKNPDVVFAASGDELLQEAMAAISLLHKDIPELKIRMVNVSELTALGLGDEKHPLSLNEKQFENYFTKDKPVIYNFHGYPGVIRNLLFGRKNTDRFSIHGYIEEGTTTTPFEMLVLNKASRYHLAIDALQKVSAQNRSIAKKASALIKKYEQKLKAHKAYIAKYGKDMPEVDNWKWE